MQIAEFLNLLLIVKGLSTFTCPQSVIFLVFHIMLTFETNIQSHKIKKSKIGKKIPSNNQIDSNQSSINA